MKRIALYWYFIALFLIIAALLYGHHLATGRTPPREAFHILGFPVYWYGIWIVSGIALGAYVVSRLGAERAERAFEAAVPTEIRQQPLVTVLPEGEPGDALRARLAGEDVQTVGDLLYPYGMDPRLLGLKKEQQAALRAALEVSPQVASQWLANAPWRQWNPDHVWNALLYCLVLGVIGARLYHVLTPPPSMAGIGITSPLDYFRNPYQLINFRAGGLGIYGGIIGGLLGLLLYAWRQRISALAWADLAAVGLALGQAIGRWGNYFNQELYGRPTTAFWAIHIEPPRLPEYANFSHFHPAFLYESLWSLGTFFVLYWLARHRADRLRTGDLTGLYLIAYAIGRTLLELVRIDSAMFTIPGIGFTLPIATVVSLALALVVAIWLIFRHRRVKPASPIA
jgi:phosphatidylglycerol:prolipoprotein diacylglycerol transferase